MYFLNSDGSKDTTNTPNTSESFCQCQICRRKRKPQRSYRHWFSWTNIIILIVIIGIVISLTCKMPESFDKMRMRFLMDKLENDYETPTAPSQPSAKMPMQKLKDIDFETALF